MFGRFCRTIFPMKALGFDAYGTLFDVFSVNSLCEELFPGHGNELAQIWRRKQLEYSWLRSLMGRYRDFWGLTEDTLVYSANSLKLDLTPKKRDQLMESYLHLAAIFRCKARSSRIETDRPATFHSLEW